MDPQDFLKIANVLVNSSEESGLRTSVSRSYYAVILFYRNYFANKVGFLPEKLGPGVHKFIPECFSECNTEEAKNICERINRLKADRTKADYILSKPVSSTKAEDCLGFAKELIERSISDETEMAVLAQVATRAKARQLI